MQNQSHLFKSRRFLPLFITQFCGAFNDNVFKNSFLIWFTFLIAKKVNFDAQMMVSISSALFILPFFFLSALAGQVADRYEKSYLIKIIKIFEILIMIFCFAGFYLQNFYLLLFLLFLMGVHSTFFGPLKYSLLPQHLKEGELISGNGLIEGGTFLAILLGTIFGGFVILTKNGIEIVCLALVVVGFIGFVASCFIPKSKSQNFNLKINLNIFLATWQSINFARKGDCEITQSNQMKGKQGLKQEKTIWQAIISISWFWFIGIIFLSQFPVYTKNIIKGDEHIVTLFFAIFSIGIGIGSAMCNKLLRGKINSRLVPTGSILISFGIFIFVVASYFYQNSLDHFLINGEQNDQLIGLKEFLFNNFHSWPIIIGLLISSVSCGVYIVPLYAIMQHRSKPQCVSQIIATNNILNALFMVFASVFIVLLSLCKLGLNEVFLIIGLMNILFLFKIKRSIKNKIL